MATFGTALEKLARVNSKKTHVSFPCVFKDEKGQSHFIDVYLLPDKADKLAEKLLELADTIRGRGGR